MEDKNPGDFWKLEDTRPKPVGNPEEFQISDFIPSAASFGEALDDLVLKACEGLEVVDHGLTLCNEMASETIGAGPTEIALSGRSTLRVGIPEALALREEEKAPKQEEGSPTKDDFAVDPPSADEIIEETKKKSAKYVANASTLKVLETGIGQYIDMLNEDQEEQKRSEQLSNEITEQLETLKSKRAMAKKQLEENPEEKGLGEKIKHTEELIALWSLVQSKALKEEKKGGLEQKIEEIKKDLEEAQSNQMIWKVMKDQSEYDLQSSAPFPENGSSKRIQQKRPESDEEHNVRLSKMFDDLDKRMAKNAEARLGNKEVKTSKYSLPATFFPNTVVKGCMDDLAVLREAGAEFLEEDFGAGLKKQELQGEPQNEVIDIDEAAAIAVTESSGIRAFIEDTRDALCDTVLDKVLEEENELLIENENAQEDFEGPQDPPAQSWLCFNENAVTQDLIQIEAREDSMAQPNVDEASEVTRPIQNLKTQKLAITAVLEDKEVLVIQDQEIIDLTEVPSATLANE